MTIANLIKEIKARSTIANSAKIAKGSISNTQVLAQLATLAAVSVDKPITPEQQKDPFESPLFETVNCNNCEHFHPDTIGDGVGIDTCDVGIKWTQEFYGRMPLYRYADRHCKKYSKIGN
jgi:hypothetical protein